MKTDATIRLFQLQIVTLSLGTFLSMGYLEHALIYLVVYTLAYYFLYQSRLSDSFYISSEKNRFSLPDSEVLFKGQLLPGHDAEDQQEDRFLSHFELSKVVKRKVLSMVFLALSGYLVFWQAQVELSLTSVIPLLCGFFIISSVYVGHLLVPLGFSIWSVVSNHRPDFHFGYYAVYSFLLFWSVQMMSEASGKQVKLKNPYFLLPMTMVFLGIVYGMTFFLPEKQDELGHPSAPAQFDPAREALADSKVKASSMAESLKSLPGSGDQELADKIFKNLKDIESAEKILSSSKLLNQNPEAARTLMNEILDQSQLLDQEFKEFKQESLTSGASGEDLLRKEVSFQDLKNLPGLLSEMDKKIENNQAALETERKELRNPEISQQDREKTVDRIDELSAAGQTLKTEVEDLNRVDHHEKEAIENYVKAKKADIEKLKAFSKNPDALDSQLDNLDQMQKLLNIPKPTTAELQALGQTLETAQKIVDIKKTEAQAPVLETKFKEAPTREEIIEPFKKKQFSFKKYLPLVVILMVFLLIQYFLKKKGVKKIETLDPEALKELIREWKKLRSLKLSPRDEVIHFYNLFHDAVQKVHYMAQETPPSCIVLEDLREVNPKLEKSIFVVTELYSQCFYGNKDVSEKAIKTFRKGILNIMKVYGIA